MNALNGNIISKFIEYFHFIFLNIQCTIIHSIIILNNCISYTVLPLTPSTQLDKIKICTLYELKIQRLAYV